MKNKEHILHMKWLLNFCVVSLGKNIITLKIVVKTELKKYYTFDLTLLICINNSDLVIYLWNTLDRAKVRYKQGRVLLCEWPCLK